MQDDTAGEPVSFPPSAEFGANIREKAMSTSYDLSEYRSVMALHHAACEAWEAYADPARCSMTTTRVKNETQEVMARKVGDLLREVQRLRDASRDALVAMDKAKKLLRAAGLVMEGGTISEQYNAAAEKLREAVAPSSQ